MARSIFECQSCLTRSLRALIAVDRSTTHQSIRKHSSTRPIHSTSAERLPSTFESRTATRVREGNGDAFHDSRAAFEQRSSQKEALRNTGLTPYQQEQRPRKGRVGDGLKESNLKAELKYLRDPLKLAEHVAYTLKEDDEDKALALTRLSSRATANVVSWNHVIDYQMKKGKTKAAFDTYNEVRYPHWSTTSKC